MGCFGQFLDLSTFLLSTDHGLQSTIYYFLLFKIYHLISIIYHLLSTIYCVLSTVYCQLSTICCLLFAVKKSGGVWSGLIWFGLVWSGLVWSKPAQKVGILVSLLGF